MEYSFSRVRKNYNKLRNQLKQHLPEMGSNIIFEEDKWFLDKLKRSPGEGNEANTFYFKPIPIKYKDLSKYYALQRCISKIATRTIATNIFSISKFLIYLVEYYPDISLSRVNKTLINQYELYLKASSYSKGTKETYWTGMSSFFITLHGWDEMPAVLPVRKLFNPFVRTKADRKIERKYIPEYVTNQLDVVFKDERIPLERRLAYWIMRSVPSRVTEVCSIKLDCLKPSYEGDGNWVIFIPTWKQSGGYREPEIRPIHIKYDGHGKYLIDLLREQQNVAISLQNRLESSQKEMLFTYSKKHFNPNLFRHKGIASWCELSLACIANQNTVKGWFNTICKTYKIVDEKGLPYNFTSHQLRHNGITDRLYEGFSLIQIRDMTGHKGNQMIQTSYVHEQPEKLLEKQRAINQSSVKQSPVYFKGRILLMDKEQEKRLLMNPRANRVGKLGICSDISSCEPGSFECLDCDYNIPDADELEYFEEQVRVWTRKVEQFKNHQFMREHAEYNLKLHQNVVDKIKNALSTQEESNYASQTK